MKELGDVWSLFHLMPKLVVVQISRILRIICTIMLGQQFYRGLLKERKKPSKQILKHQFQKQ